MQNGNSKFSSFIWAGFECASPLTKHRRLDMLHETRHDAYIYEDYQNLKKYGIRTVREGFSWSRIDLGEGRYNFAKYDEILKAGREEKMQQIWDLNHFDYPIGLNPLSEEFVRSFTRYGLKAIEFLRQYISGDLYIVPINEISYFSWISADYGKWAPFLKGEKNGFLMKENLVRAVISLIKEIKKLDKGIYFIHPDPLMWRVAKKPVNKYTFDYVKEFNKNIRFQSLDMLSGKRNPELGGEISFIDFIGINYYEINQEYIIMKSSGKLGHRTIPLTSKDRIPFGILLKETYERYGKPLVISETGSYNNKRMAWWKHILDEVQIVSRLIPLLGTCAYPVLDGPDVSHLLRAKSGLWDFNQNNAKRERIPYESLLSYIQKHQANLDISK